MAEDFGNGVSRTLSAINRQFQAVVWQADKPPLDSELNLMAQVEWERLGNIVRSQMHSGFLADPVVADTDFVTDRDYSNYFKLGRNFTGAQAPVLWANVNGWIVPVTGTSSLESTNKVSLYPAPDTDTRIDFVFLEVWLTNVAPNPSTVNKPSASTIWKYGNVKFGGTNPPDDLEDPTIGFETTERIQLQYRIRVYGQGAGAGSSVALSVYPDGLDDPSIKAQATSSSPVAAYAWSNMRDILGDPGLWRAGDGDPNNALGTVDGYSYAIPICAVFRRNSSTFVARTNSGNANQNGSFERNPITVAITDPEEATRTFSQVTLTASLNATATGAISVTGLSGSGLDNTNLYSSGSVFFYLDGELVEVQSVNAGAGTITIGSRGRLGTQAVPHDLGTELRFYSLRPDGLFADQIESRDIMDLRKSVTLGEWDYNQLLVKNLQAVLSNKLHSTYKQSGVSDTEGVIVPEVNEMISGTAPNQTEKVDFPDGIREVFSDAAVVQSNVSVILQPTFGGGAVPVAVTDYTAAAPIWEISADFVPNGFQPTTQGFSNGAVINLFIGGASGNDGARKSMGGARAVRFASPRELWVDGQSGNRTPFTLSFLGSTTAATDGLFTEPPVSGESDTDHPGPMYPLSELNFEYPFIVLGGIINNELRSISAEVVSSGSSASGYPEVRYSGLDFDSNGLWIWLADPLNPADVTKPVLQGRRTLYDMITKGGTDFTGDSSEVYIVVTGDTTNPENCGVFKVIGAGSSSGYYTSFVGSTADALVVKKVQEGWTDFVDAVNLTAEVRSQYMNTEDGPLASAGNAASAVVVLTDLSGVNGGVANPWSSSVLNLTQMTFPNDSAVVLNTSLMYSPGRGAMARVPDRVTRFASVNPPSMANLLRRNVGALDPDSQTEAGLPTSEIYYDPQGIQTWSVLSSNGLTAPDALEQGEGRGQLTEQLRDAELFVDNGSKTVAFRPFRKVNLSLNQRDVSTDGGITLIPAAYPSAIPVDGANLFLTGGSGRTYCYGLPPAIMPKFGRQDIPVRAYGPSDVISTQPYFFGVNHLFADSTSNSDSVFNIIGGKTNSGVAGVTSMFIQTDSASGLDYGEYGAIPGGNFGYQARHYDDLNVRSSDLPPGLKGIQLPPFLGVARVYGVYDARDWAGTGAWQADRVTPETGGSPPKNLIRTDADKQTLFILKGGASDITLNVNDHTYIIPENLINISLSDSFVSGTDTFDNMDFVVECQVFGFSRGFINLNNYVLARAFNGQGNVPSGLIDGIAMTLPLPAPVMECYTVTDRTVYQGDPYMTRDGDTRVVSDYEPRYGQVSVANAFELATAIQQFDNGSFVPEYPNPRALEVLAIADFYTTLGTGKIGGMVNPGTATDVGHVESSGTRIPTSATANQFQAEGRSFSQGQPEEAPRGSLSLRVLQNSATSAGESFSFYLDGSLQITVTSNAQFSGGSVSATAQDLADYINTAAILSLKMGLNAVWNGANEVLIESKRPGAEAARAVQVRVNPKTGQTSASGLSLVVPSSFQPRVTSSLLLGGADVPVNGARLPSAPSPISLTGATERLPLGILLNDSDFIGEDPARNGESALSIRLSAGTNSILTTSPGINGTEYARLSGLGFLGMADGSILLYTPWTTSSLTGTKRYRLYRGGGSLYVLDPQNPGGPVDWTSGSLPEGSSLKGAILAGRAYLVRNYKETAFLSSNTVSYGDELQLVVVTRGILGEGLGCKEGYAMFGQISPTGYGEGYTAADRYRLEGKPLHSGTSKAGPNPVVDLAPYPTTDPQPIGPC